ncbi:MAG: hypothetical protein U1E51_25190 [Candidatus Binatia bacterium]|nr:hypothetical protein [Candidatus Binatia bacterium]
MRGLPGLIFYHGTPLGGPSADKARALQGRHALIPFTDTRDIGIAAEVCQSFVLDNGAFSVWKRGEVLDVPGYIAWCYEWHRHPGFDWALIPDVIEGNEDDNDALLEAWPTDIRGVPVWHMHESIDRLTRLANEYETVALGSSGHWPTPGEANWWNRMADVMEAICDDGGRPPCRLHGLRMLDPDIFTRLPLSSADSVNAGLNNNRHTRFGMYVPPTAAQRTVVIMDRIEAQSSAPIWIRINQNGLFEDSAQRETLWANGAGA